MNKGKMSIWAGVLLVACLVASSAHSAVLAPRMNADLLWEPTESMMVFFVNSSVSLPDLYLYDPAGSQEPVAVFDVSAYVPVYTAYEQGSDTLLLYRNSYATEPVLTLPRGAFLLGDSTGPGGYHFEMITEFGTSDHFDVTIPDDGTVPMSSSTAMIGGVSPVPVPGAAWLLGSGLVGLIGVRRKKK